MSHTSNKIYPTNLAKVQPPVCQYVDQKNLPSSRWWWWRKRKIPCSATTPATSTRRRWRRSLRRAHIIVISSRWRHRTPTATRRHSVQTTSSPHGKSHRTSTAVIKHHCKATVIIGFIVKVGIIRLCTSFDGRLKQKHKLYYKPKKTTLVHHQALFLQNS